MNHYPPPFPWGYGGPQDNGMSRKELDRIAKNAVRDALRLKGMDKQSKRKRKEESSKKAAVKRQRFFNFIEIFILGVLLHPIVGPLYHLVVNKLTAQ